MMRSAIRRLLLTRRKRASLHILDHFTGADGTALSAHTPDINTPGGAWANVAGTWNIQSNRANAAVLNGDGIAVCAIDAGKSDVNLSAILNTSTGGGAGYGFACRYTALTDFWLLLFVQNTGTIYIIEVSGGTSTIRASTSSVSIAENTDYTATATLSGTSLSFSMAGKTVSYNSATSNQTATKFGFRTGYVGHRADDFEVTP